MRVNKFVALATGMSRRDGDQAITEGKVYINDEPAVIGAIVADGDVVTLNGNLIKLPNQTATIILNKPAGYVCSREGQGSATIYDLLPPDYRSLKPAGRLDKDSSGLLLLTNDGQLADQLTHPRYAKTKVYEVTLDKSLASADKTKIESGVKIDDYISSLKLSKVQNNSCIVTMSEGKNRQIRRTFAALGYNVTRLHRTHFGNYKLDTLPPGKFQTVN